MDQSKPIPAGKGGYWRLLIQLILLVIIWYLLWQTSVGFSINEKAYVDKSFRVVVLIGTILLALLIGFLNEVIRSVSNSETIHVKLGTISGLSINFSGLFGFLVFSLVWISFFRFSSFKPLVFQKFSLAEDYRYYILLLVSAIGYFIFEQFAYATKSLLAEKYKTQFASDKQRTVRKRIIYFSYLLLLLLLIISNGMIQNFWLYLFSILILQLVFPFLQVFSLTKFTSSAEEKTYKNWLVKKGNSEKGK